MLRNKMLAIVACLAIAGVATAQSTDFTVTNNSGAAQSKLAMTFAGAGSHTNLVPISWPGGCASPTVLVNPDDTITLDFATDCVMPGLTVKIRVQPSTGVSCLSGVWTNVALATAPVACGADVASAAGPAIPTVSQWGLIVMTLLLLTAATVIFARRRPTTVHSH